MDGVKDYGESGVEIVIDGLHFCFDDRDAAKDLLDSQCDRSYG